jgi:predicted transcriptional regulator of viral defense system
MNYIQRLLLSPNTVFTTNDLKLLWHSAAEDQVKQYVQYHTKRGNLVRIQRGVYSLPSRVVNPLELGNKLRSPSYVSFETVLLEHGVVFQWSDVIRLASSESVRLAAVDFQYSYTQLKKTVLLNSNGIEQKENYYIANRERAFLDTLYIDPNYHFDNVSGIDFDSAMTIAKIYKTNSLIERLKDWRKHVGSL